MLILISIFISVLQDNKLSFMLKKRFIYYTAHLPKGHFKDILTAFVNNHAEGFFLRTLLYYIQGDPRIDGTTAVYASTTLRQRVQSHPSEKLTNGLRQYLKDESSGIRSSAVIFFTLTKAPNYIDVLLNMAEEEKSNIVMMNIIDSFIDSNPRLNRGVLDFIINDALNHESPRIRAFTIHSLGVKVDPFYKDVIIKKLKDNDRNVRLSAIETLGWIGDRSVINKLEPFQNDKDPLISQTAIDSIKTIKKHHPASLPSSNASK